MMMKTIHPYWLLKHCQKAVIEEPLLSLPNEHKSHHLLTHCNAIMARCC